MSKKKTTSGRPLVDYNHYECIINEVNLKKTNQTKLIEKLSIQFGTIGKKIIFLIRFFKFGKKNKWIIIIPITVSPV